MSFGKITARQIWCKSSGYIDTDRFIIHKNGRFSQLCQRWRKEI